MNVRGIVGLIFTLPSYVDLVKVFAKLPNHYAIYLHFMFVFADRLQSF